MSMLNLTYEVDGDDFTRAGEASSAVKKCLRSLGISPEAIRKWRSPFTRERSIW